MKTLTLSLAFWLGFVSVPPLPAQAPAGSAPAVARNDPAAVANEILRIIRAGDADALLALGNSVNRRKMSPLDEAKREKLAKYFAKCRENIGPVEKVSEIREGPSFAPGTIVAKIRQVGDEVFVVVLEKEGDSYCFEDINSPDAASYAKLKLLGECAAGGARR